MLRYLTRVREQGHEVMIHEIHDGTCPYMTAARAALDSFYQGNREKTAADWTTFDMGMALLNYAADELQRVLRGLRPFHLAAGNLPKAIDCLLQQVRAVGGPEVEFYHDVEPERIPARLEVAVYRIVQESLANVCRHSKSTKALVGLTEDDEFLCVRNPRLGDWI